MPHIYIAPFICQSTSVPVTSFNPHNSLVLPGGNRGGDAAMCSQLSSELGPRLLRPAQSTVPGLTASRMALGWLLNHRESASSFRTDCSLFLAHRVPCCVYSKCWVSTYRVRLWHRPLVFLQGEQESWSLGSHRGSLRV